MKADFFTSSCWNESRIAGDGCWMTVAWISELSFKDNIHILLREACIVSCWGERDVAVNGLSLNDNGVYSHYRYLHSLSMIFRTKFTSRIYRSRASKVNASLGGWLSITDNRKNNHITIENRNIRLTLCGPWSSRNHQDKRQHCNQDRGTPSWSEGRKLRDRDVWLWDKSFNVS